MCPVCGNRVQEVENLQSELKPGVVFAAIFLSPLFPLLWAEQGRHLEP